MWVIPLRLWENDSTLTNEERQELIKHIHPFPAPDDDYESKWITLSGSFLTEKTGTTENG